MTEGLKRLLSVVYWYPSGLSMIKYVYTTCKMATLKLNDFIISCDITALVLFCT